MSSKIILG